MTEIAKFLAVWGVLSAMSTQSSPDNVLSPEEKNAGWRLLFDGATLQGWRGYKKDTCPDGWQVVDGALTRVKGGGDLVTVETFDDFELSIDWRIAPRGNSGIMYRVAETEGASYMTGPEYQILDHAGHGDGRNTLTSAASCYGLYAPMKDVAKPAGQWNRARIIARGNHVEHWLNGEKVVEYEIASDDWNQRVARSKFKAWPQFAKVPKGHLCLQDHGDRVEYKNIKIRVLSGK